MLRKIIDPYKGVFKIINLYWKIYGGWGSLVFSPYFHISIILTGLMSHFWLKELWWDTSISTLPSIIGFALGGYAIWLGFGDEKFRNLISDKGESTGYSAYLEVSATFAHFIFIQLIALCFALFAKAMNFPLSEVPWLYESFIKLNISICFFHDVIKPIAYGIGFLLFVYAIMTAIAATLAVFRVAYWFDTFRNSNNNNPPKSK